MDEDSAVTEPREDLTVNGKGSQTCSFQYIRPVDGTHELSSSFPSAMSCYDSITASYRVNIAHVGLPMDDPQERRPDTASTKTSPDCYDMPWPGSRSLVRVEEWHVESLAPNPPPL
ncbi:hypothetical protein EDB87DRAFT_1694228 [Lactarius vividus]|nr:hypothetical protein EDB87DRAFT_1694228 [Lactarius vividus]